MLERAGHLLLDGAALFISAFLIKLGKGTILAASPARLYLFKIKDYILKNFLTFKKMFTD